MNETSDIGPITRRAAVRIIMAVTLKKRPLDIAFDDICRDAKLEGRDRAFVMTLVMIALRERGSLLGLLDTLLDRTLPFEATWTKAALSAALAEVLRMNTPDHAAVHQYVDLIKNLKGKEKGFAPLVNAILRRTVREKDKCAAWLNDNVILNIPDWLRESWAGNFDADGLTVLAQSLTTAPPLDIWVKTDPKAWAEKLNAVLTETGSLRRTFTDVRALEGFDDGHWWVQDMAAALPVQFLGDVEGKSVADLCAAPGGKTMQLASMGAHVTAVDRNKNRLKRLHANLDRTKMKATVINMDAATFALDEPFDAILLDAPCSATGTFRRNPDVMWTKDDNDVSKLAALQARLLDHAFTILKDGGRMVYCVCSLEAAEGQDQIDAFIARTPAAKLVPVTADNVGGITELITQDGTMLAHPGIKADAGGMDGFFAAILEKQQNT